MYYANARHEKHNQHKLLCLVNYTKYKSWNNKRNKSVYLNTNLINFLQMK